MNDAKHAQERYRLPHWAERLLRWMTPVYSRDIVIGDFAEVFRQIAARQGRGRALCWYWGQVLKSAPAFLSTSVYFGGIMLKNHFKMAFRNFKKQKGYTFINISGLALGIACCVLILRFVQDERAYDRFYEQSDQIYRVAIREVTPTSDVYYAPSPYPLAATLVNDYPEVLRATRVAGRQSFAVSYQDRLFDETRIHRADTNFFDVFKLPFVKGDPATALREPSSVVITASTAKKYFGEDDPIGKVLDVKNGIATSTPYTVTAVVEDLPDQAHFHFDVLTSFFRAGQPRREEEGWFGYGVYTYLMLDAGHRPEDLEAKFPDMLKRYGGPQFEQNRGVPFEEHLASNGYYYFLQPLTDIHLHSNLVAEIEANGNATYVTLFAAIALFILLIACINYMNLATARSAGRAREIGVRKVMGSNRRQLIFQILTESVLMSVLAFGVGLLLVAGVGPMFSAFTGKTLDAVSFQGGSMIALFLAGAITVGVLAGSYPAFFLSAFRPVAVLKGMGGGGASPSAFRNGLVVFQFVVSIALLVGTFVVQGQMDYMLNKSLGFDKEHVIVIERAWALGEQDDVFKQEVAAHPGVVQVSGADHVPGKRISELFMAPEHADGSVQYNVLAMEADYDYVQTIGFEVVQGRTFDPALASDSMAVVVNETLVRLMGFTDDPIGQRIRITGARDTHYPIIGVVRDFHVKSLHDPIEPYAYFLEDGVPDRVVVRVGSEAISETLAFLEATWGRFLSDRPFNYSFLEADLDALYRAEVQTRTLFGVFAMLAIVIACLGLFGLSAFVAERRTREIGVRKVLGATMPSIMLLLSSDFLKLVVLAFAVAVPVAYLAMDRWLQAFSYRIEISGRIFLLAGLTALGVALLTVSYQSVKAARGNPVEALRYE